MIKQYDLQKEVWTEADFEQMNWHDCPIYAISFGNEYQLLLDIDYMFEWVLMKNKRNYQFWIAPCTLVFENVYNIAFETDHTNLIIDSISRENPQTPKNVAYVDRDVEYDWMVETTVGELSFKSIGYKQYVRQKPVLLRDQKLSSADRGGISFSTTSTA